MNDKTPSAAALLDRIDLPGQDSSQIVRTISSIFNAPDYHQLLSTFQGDATRPPPENAIKFVNALDKACFLSSNRLLSHQELPLVQALGYDDGLPETKSKLHRALRKTCAEVGILPSSYYLDNNQMSKVNDVPFASGGYSDVWRGSYKGGDVSIKAFRVYTTDNIRQLTKVFNFLPNDGVNDH